MNEKNKKNKKSNLFSLIGLGLAGVVVGVFLSSLLYKLDLNTVDLTINPILLQLVPTLPLLIMLLKHVSISKLIKLDNFSNDENSVYEKNQSNITMWTGISTILIIINFMMFGVNFSGNFLENAFNSENSILVFLIFTSNAILGSFLEIAYTNLIKKVEPQKNADASELNYNQKMLETLDEYEIQLVGKAAAKTMGYMVFVYLFIFLIGVVTGQSALFFICTLGIWAVSQGIYIHQYCTMGKSKN